jgi:hypothetical protein
MHKKVWRIPALMQIKRDVKQKKNRYREKQSIFFFILSWKIKSFLAKIYIGLLLVNLKTVCVVEA